MVRFGKDVWARRGDVGQGNVRYVTVRQGC